MRDIVAGEPAGGWHALAADDALRALGSSSNGLTAEEARRRLARVGPNRLAERPRAGAWERLAGQFHNPLIYVLLATACVTSLLGHWVDTGVIVGVVVVNAIIGFVQESRAEQAIDSLRRMLAPVAVALRDGSRTSVPAVELVPGDVVILRAGDKVPADMRLLEVRDLRVDEAPLTGESAPVDKTPAVLPSATMLADRRSMAYAGTLVTTGVASAVVVATGDATQLGRIAGMLEDVEGVDTPLIRRLARFSKTITVVIVALCVLAFAAGVLAGREPLQMLLAAVALAVSAIPEGLPAIMTIALAIGVKRMAARDAVIRKLPAVEALGSVTVICTDKTGTLTRNEMTVTRIETVAGAYTVSGAGYAPVGEIRDGGGRAVDEEIPPALRELMVAGALCNEAAVRRRDGDWAIDGDPTEGALLVLAAKAGLDRDALAGAWPRRDVIPFDSEQQFMATLHHDHAGGAAVHMKGAPETVIPRCDREWSGELPLDAARWRAAAHDMAADGLRVLALAAKPADAQQADLRYEDATGGFALLGLVGILDPPREDAVAAVAQCIGAGIRVKMITGDHVATARTVARALGIGDGGRALTGADLDRLDEAELDAAAAAVDVFARVSPAHKLRLVRSLQRQGQVVAMTGDGVNDAPALRQADIGVAMGVTGTDVSKEAADMVLLDDDFVSIQQAIVEGRTVFNNLKKTIVFILPTNGGECLTLIAALIFATVLPILPLHVLWINLVTTVALAITLAFDPVDPDVMHRPPREPDAPLIDGALVWRIAYVSLLMTLGTFGLFFHELGAGSSLETARAVAVNAIVAFEVAYVFNSRHLTRPVLRRRELTANPVVWVGIAAVVILQIAFTHWPLMNALFGVAPLDAWMWLRVLAAGVLLLLLVEAEKLVVRRLGARGRRRDGAAAEPGP